MRERRKVGWPQVPTYFVGGLWVYSAQIMRGGFALLVATTASHLLTISQFGLYSFVQSYFQWLALLAELGIAISTARLLTISDRSTYDEILSTFVVTLGAVSVVAVVITAGGVAPLIHYLVPDNVGQILAICAVPGIGIIWLTALREVLPALSRMKTIAVIEAAPWLLLFVLVIAFSRYTLTAQVLSLLFVCSYLVVTMLVSWNLVRFRWPSKASLLQTLRMDRQFGFAVYMGRLIGTGGFILDIPLITFFLHDTSKVALYAMSKALAAPITLVGQAIATALFRDFAHSKRIPRSALIIVCSATGALGLGYILIGPSVVRWALPPAYQEMLPYLMIWVATCCAQSLYQIPTMFLRAHGQGKTLRTLALIFGAVSAVAYMVLIPLYSIAGACFAAFCAVFAWLSGSWAAYFWLRRNLEKT